MPEVQDIFRQYGDEHLKQSHPPPRVRKTVRTIQNCRTAALGGHRDTCDQCGYVKISYNSCRNRHCPKCQALAKEQWILNRGADLLPVGYFHVVFTLPQELDEVCIHNREAFFNLLFKSSAETLKTLALNKKYLGAETGFISILYTWGQNLMFHPHIHIILPGGGLTRDGEWRNARNKFFIPVKVLAKLFRGKFLHALREMRQKVRGLEDDSVWRKLADTLYAKDWYVYCKRPFKTRRSVLQYLGRYTHRVAISNHRILSIHDATVSFKWRDYKDGSKEKVMSLSASEFMRRFLLHILPPGFTKIRHYGVLSPAVKKKKLTLAKKLTNARITEKVSLSTVELMKRITGRDITLIRRDNLGGYPVSLSRRISDNY